MRVVAVDVRDRPSDIPTSKWIVKDAVYTVIQVFTDLNGKLGYVLNELEPGAPYLGYQADRFRPATEGDGESVEDVKELEYA